MELSTLGRELAETHLNYEDAEKFPLELYEIPQKIQHDEKTFLALKQFEKLNIKLHVKKEEGLVILDDNHILKGIPKEVFDCKIGSKSPIEWVCSENCFLPYKYDMKEETRFYFHKWTITTGRK